MEFKAPFYRIYQWVVSLYSVAKIITAEDAEFAELF